MIRTFTEDVYRVQLVNPQTLNNTANTSSYVDVGDYERVVAVLAVGSTDTTVDFKLVQATDSSGTGSKDVSGAAITQLSGTDDNKQVAIELETRKLDINNGFHYVAAMTTIGNGTTGAVVAAALYGVNPGGAPVTQPSAFAQQVVVAG